MSESQAHATTAHSVLLIDDEQHIADVVVYALEEHGFRIRTALDGDAGLARYEASRPDLVLLDLNLPGLSGLDLFQAIRARRPEQAIIMLTARGDEIDRILGLELGADDYVTKPFSPRELVARVKAVLRRCAAPAPPAPPRLCQGPFELDEAGFALTYQGMPVQLTRAEFRLLAQLVRHPARVFTRDTLMQQIYEDDHLVTDRSIDAYVKRLRKKLGAVRPDDDPIETVYGIGYKLRHPQEGAP